METAEDKGPDARSVVQYQEACERLWKLVKERDRLLEILAVATSAAVNGIPQPRFILDFDIDRAAACLRGIDELTVAIEAALDEVNRHAAPARQPMIGWRRSHLRDM